MVSLYLKMGWTVLDNQALTWIFGGGCREYFTRTLVVVTESISQEQRKLKFSIGAALPI